MTVDELVERLVLEADAAIRREAGSLAYDLHRVRGLTLEFDVGPHGRIDATHVYISRHALRAQPQ